MTDKMELLKRTKLFVLDMVCALTIALIDLAFPYLSRWCMYELLPQNAYRTFFTVMAVAAAAFAVRGVLTYIIGYYGHTFGILVEADIRRICSATCRNWISATMTAIGPAP